MESFRQDGVLRWRRRLQTTVCVIALRRAEAPQIVGRMSINCLRNASLASYEGMSTCSIPQSGEPRPTFFRG